MQLTSARYLSLQPNTKRLGRDTIAAMDWASLLQTLLLGDNQLRSQAEDAYNASKQQNPHEVRRSLC